MGTQKTPYAECRQILKFSTAKNFTPHVMLTLAGLQI